MANSSLSQVADLLDQASRLLRDAGTISNNNNNNITSSINSYNNSNTNDVNSNNNTVNSSNIQHVLGAARNMLRSSNSGGLFSRLNRTERLRSSHPYTTTTGPNRRISSSSGSSTSSTSSSRQKKPAEKTFEYALLKNDEEDEEDVWHQTIKWDSVIANGMVNIREDENESDIRDKLVMSLTKAFPLIGANDFNFVKVKRKEITRLNLGRGMEYGFSVLKKMAGQGLLYLQMKREFKFILNDESSASSEDDSNKEKITEEDNKDEAIIDLTLASPTSSIAPTSAIEATPAVEPTPTMEPAEVLFPPDNIRSAVAQAQATPNLLENPVETLRFLRSILQTGRDLDLVSIDVETAGLTNYISIDRHNLLPSTFQELDYISDYFTTYEVDFMGEKAQDLGGPRREWLRLCCLAIKEKYFDGGLKEYLANDYYHVGIILGTSLFQGGPVPTYLVSELVTKLIGGYSLSSAEKRLRGGMEKLGIVYMLKELPLFKHLFLNNNRSALTVKMFLNLIEVKFSEEGTNSLVKEKEVFTAFVGYLREVSSGRRPSVTLNKILAFITGAEEEPLLGFSTKPSICFVTADEDSSDKLFAFIPRGHTCANILHLPRGNVAMEIPSAEKLFALYDTAFVNVEHFGSV